MKVGMLKTVSRITTSMRSSVRHGTAATRSHISQPPSRFSNAGRGAVKLNSRASQREEYGKHVHSSAPLASKEKVTDVVHISRDECGKESTNILQLLPVGVLAALFLCNADIALAEPLAILPTTPSEFSLTTVLSGIEDLGDVGALLLVLLVTLAEMVPLVPTQPLAVASGLIFGWEEGIPLALTGTTLAGLFAFLISRALGDRFIALTNSAGSVGEFAELEGDGMQKQLSKISGLVEAGSAVECAMKVMLLRFSPVVPYSLSNYLMGLTKLPLLSFVAGTFVGMLPWMAFYATVGSTGRALLANGEGVEQVIQGLLEKAEGTLAGPIEGLVIASVLAIAYGGIRMARNRDPGIE